MRTALLALLLVGCSGRSPVGATTPVSVSVIRYEAGFLSYVEVDRVRTRAHGRRDSVYETRVSIVECSPEGCRRNLLPGVVR